MDFTILYVHIDRCSSSFLIDKKEYEQRSYMRINWKEIPECEDIWGLIDISVEIISKEDAVLVLGKTRCNRYLAKGFIKKQNYCKKSIKNHWKNG